MTAPHLSAPSSTKKSKLCDTAISNAAVCRPLSHMNKTNTPSHHCHQVKSQRSIDLITMGCSKNLVDSERLLRRFADAGCRVFHNPETIHGDIAVVNTCGFIGDAKEESINMILSLADAKEDGDLKEIYVMGCLSERYRKELAEEIPQVDRFYGKFDWDGLIADLRLTPAACPTADDRLLTTPGHYAYIKIAEGCNRRCAYCAIPLIRGKQVSRSIEDIVAEAKELEAQGVQEITLIAQDTTYFGREKGKKGGTLAQLLRAILDNTNIPWIRTLYWYPMFVDDELLDLMASEPRLVKYVDMPIQHASDNVLKNMKRNYRKKELVDILHKIRERIPGVTLRTTVLVGFPGETHEDFEELMDLLEDIKFDHLGGFVFSPEEGTPVMEMDLLAVDESEARARLDAVTDLQEELDVEHAEAMIGKTVRVIIDQVAEESEYHFYGRTEGNSMENDDIVKVLEGDADVGEFRDALVVDAEPHELIVKLV